MNKRITLISIAILAAAVAAYAAWYSYERHAKLAQAEECGSMLANPPEPAMVAGPGGEPAPLYTLNGCAAVVVPPPLWDLLRGKMAFENVPERMKVNPYSFADVLLGRYTFGPADVGCDQSATTTDCIIAKKQADPGFIPTPGSDEPPPPLTLGIQDAVSPTLLGQNLILGTNSWQGYVGGTLTSVTGTAQAADPSQGALFVWEPDNGVESSRTYPAPTATGPLKIVSEADGVLTIESLAGTYEVYDINTDARHYVTSTGGATYTFDVEARTFK
jgi:hypothetical protein